VNTPVPDNRILTLGTLELYRPLARCLTALLLALGPVPGGLGCSPGSKGGEGAGAPPTQMVRINRQEIPYREFEAYLEASLGEERPPADDAETQSRLLDQFIEERLLLQAAQARQIRVSDKVLDAYIANLGMSSDPGRGGKPVDGAFREQIRQSLLIQEFKDQVLLHDVRVQPEEVETYFREHPDEFREARVVILRQILLDDDGEAKKVLSSLREDPGQFQILAERHSTSPDRGQPRPYEESELPEVVRNTVFALEPGQISDLVGEGGKYRIFQAVDRHEGKNQSLEEVRKRIEVLLLQKKVEETLSKALADLKVKSRIQVHAESLPFRYSGEYPR